jgi:hypothetical protein
MDDAEARRIAREERRKKMEEEMKAADAELEARKRERQQRREVSGEDMCESKKLRIGRENSGSQFFFFFFFSFFSCFPRLGRRKLLRKRPN